MIRLVCGKGLNDMPKGTCSVKGVKLPFYKAWKSMLERCYTESGPTYIECTVCEDWLILSKFKIWFDDNYVKDWCLDKDILIKGNKVYSPTTCTYIPHQLNTLLLAEKSTKGEYPVGVSKQGNKFEAKVSFKGKGIYLGLFNTPEEAAQVYINKKIEIVDQVLEEHSALVPTQTLNAIREHVCGKTISISCTESTLKY